MIDRSSPVKQNIGDFVDEEEKILALFKVLKHIDHGYYNLGSRAIVDVGPPGAPNNFFRKNPRF